MKGYVCYKCGSKEPTHKCSESEPTVVSSELIRQLCKLIRRNSHLIWFAFVLEAAGWTLLHWQWWLAVVPMLIFDVLRED